MHTHAAILSTGDEIILGQLQDANARWFAQRLSDLGIKPVELAGVGDDLETLAATIRRLAAAAPLVIMSGGLGPTDGDLTRPAIARVLNCEQVIDDAALRDLEAKLAARGRPMTDRLKRQAFRPQPATCLPNRFGTAPGLHVVLPQAGPHGDTEVFCLPGPPGELRPMFEDAVVPRLRPDPSCAVRTRLLHVVGLAESDAVQRLGDLTRRDRVPLVGVTASGGQLTVRLRAEGRPADRADAELDDTARAVRAALQPYIFGEGDTSLPAALLAALRSRGQTLAVAESCTGGLLGKLLTDVPGSSEVFLGGWITYANQAKTRELGVPADLIARHGAVSEPVARAMAAAALARSNADHALAITGIAGPGGGREHKPVGTVFIAHAARAPGPVPGDAATPGVSRSGPTESTASPLIDVRHLRIPGDRADVRARAANAALTLLWLTPPAPPPALRLLWEHRSA